MLSPDVCRSFFWTPLSSRDLCTAVAERFADARAADTDGAVATTEASSRSVSGVPATFAVAPTLMPGPPSTGTVEGWVEAALEALVKVAAAAGAPPERVAPMTYTTVSAMTPRTTRAARREVMVTVMCL